MSQRLRFNYPRYKLQQIKITKLHLQNANTMLQLQIQNGGLL